MNRTLIEQSPLLTDFYQLTMLQAYFDEGMDELAVFEFFVRKMPDTRNFFMVAGIEEVLHFLDKIKFSAAELDYLHQDKHFSPEFLKYLENFKFTGDVNGMIEGTLVFPNEPIIQIIAPLQQAQLIESRLINLMQYQIMICSKAARCVLAAPNKQLIDFGMRRAHGAEAALFASRSNYLAGFAGTSTVLAGKVYDIPTYGTMAHSYIQAHGDESTAFYNFAKSHPENVVLLIDTYDTENGAKIVTELAPKLKLEGIKINAVRLDSGDLGKHAVNVRKILNDGNCHDTKIFASGDLDEHKLHSLVSGGYPIDGFGVGTKLDTCSDAPYLDCAYKLQAYAGQACRKKSEGKETWPGQKQVYRYFDNDSKKIIYDTVTLHDEANQKGEALLQPLMRSGKIIKCPSLKESKKNAQKNLIQLPDNFKSVQKAKDDYQINISDKLKQLARQVDARQY